MPITLTRRKERRFAVTPAALMLGLVFSILPLTVRAEDGGRYTLVEENDYFFYPTDHWYTQGFLASYLTGEVQSGDTSAGLFDALHGNLFADGASMSRHVDWGFGQSIFTPTNLEAITPDPRDRPYAGWLYLQGGLVQSTDKDRLDDLELQFGVVGPMALAEESQNDWHEYFMHQAVSQGWDHQLRNEPGLDLTYLRKWRYTLAGQDERFSADFVPDAGMALGNVLTYANAGAMVRLGYHLSADYGPPRILPSTTGSDYFDSSVTGIGGYIFAAVEGRAIARNIFLDGNSFQSSPHVTSYPAVGDFVFGGTLFWGQYLRATLSLDNRSREFVGQQGPDRFTSMSLSANFDW